MHLFLADHKPVLQAVQYIDSQDIDGDFEEYPDDGEDEEFVAPGSKGVPRKRLESML